jgi:hypothetical protein
MLPPSLLPELYAQGSLERLAHSALPDAPVKPHVAHTHHLRRAVVRRLAKLGRLPAAQTRSRRTDRCKHVPEPAR